MSTGILLAQATVGPEQRYTVVLKYSYRQNARMCMDSLQELYSTVQYSTIDSSKFSLSLTRPAWNFDKTNFFSAITRSFALVDL